MKRMMTTERQRELLRELMEYEQTKPMTEEEQETYLSGYGHYTIPEEKAPAPVPAYEELKAKTQKLYKTCMLYWEVLVRNDLREEADEYVQEHIDDEMPFDIFY